MPATAAAGPAPGVAERQAEPAQPVELVGVLLRVHRLAVGNVGRNNAPSVHRGGNDALLLVGEPGDVLEVKEPVLWRNGAPITGAKAFAMNANREGKFRGYGYAPESMAVYAKEHRQIVKAIAAGDVEAAGRAMFDHVMASRERTRIKHGLADEGGTAPTPAAPATPSRATRPRSAARRGA